MAPRLNLEEHLGSRKGKELQKMVALNSWKRRVGCGVKPGTSFSDSKQQLIVKNMGYVRSPGESSSGTAKQCEVPLIDKSTGSVESPQASPFDTAKQCEAPSIDKSKGGGESPRPSSSNTERQCEVPSIDKSTGNVESPRVSSSDAEKQSSITRGIILR